MTRATIAGVVVAAVLVLVVLAVGHRVLQQQGGAAGAASPAAAPPASGSPGPGSPNPGAAGAVHPAFLYGRVTTHDGATYEGRLRWGGGEEAFWDDYFNGFKKDNPWVVHLPPERRTVRDPIRIFGVEIVQRERPVDFGRAFMVRFGDVVRIESAGGDGEAVVGGEVFYPDVRVTLKSGREVELDRMEAGDFDDGLRVWDATRGVVDLEPRRIRSITLLPVDRAVAGKAADPGRLHGTVQTPHGGFTGFVHWNREETLGADRLDGRTADGPASLRFDTIRSIARHSEDSSRVTLRYGRQVVLSGTPEVGRHRGLFVDDPRYGRVLVSWEAFRRVDFHPGGSGRAYDDFPPGRPLTGSVTTRAGRRLAGRLVYDLDEAETVETLDAPFRGLDYTIPFGRIASVVLPGGGDGGLATVTLHTGEEVVLQRSGDLGEGNAGLLVFVDGSRQPGYVPWSEVGRVDFDGPRTPATGEEEPPSG